MDVSPEGNPPRPLEVQRAEDAAHCSLSEEPVPGAAANPQRLCFIGPIDLLLKCWKAPKENPLAWLLWRRMRRAVWVGLGVLAVLQVLVMVLFLASVTRAGAGMNLGVVVLAGAIFGGFQLLLQLLPFIWPYFFAIWAYRKTFLDDEHLRLAPFGPAERQLAIISCGYRTLIYFYAISMLIGVVFSLLFLPLAAFSAMAAPAPNLTDYIAYIGIDDVLFWIAGFVLNVLGQLVIVLPMLALAHGRALAWRKGAGNNGEGWSYIVSPYLLLILWSTLFGLLGNLMGLPLHWGLDRADLRSSDVLMFTLALVAIGILVQGLIAWAVLVRAWKSFSIRWDQLQAELPNLVFQSRA